MMTAAGSRTITVSRQRAGDALLRARLDEESDFIRACAVPPFDELVVTFQVDVEQRIVKLLYPELAQLMAVVKRSTPSLACRTKLEPGEILARIPLGARPL